MSIWEKVGFFRRDLNSLEKILIILFLLFFPPALIVFRKRSNRNKQHLVLGIALVLTWIFIVLTLASQSAIKSSALSETNIPSFWVWIHTITRPLFITFDHLISYIIVFAIFLLGGSLLIELIPSKK